MNILFVSAVFPYPLHSGGQVRVYNLLSRLSRKHNITLLSYIRREDENAYITRLKFCSSVRTVYRGNAWQIGYVARSVFGPYPLLMTTYDNRHMRRLVREELATSSYDLIHIEPFYVWPSISGFKLPLVVGKHNIEYEVYREYVRRFPFVPLRPLLSFDVAKLRYWERRILKQASAATVVSQSDALHIQAYCRSVSVVPNGVDTEAFRFAAKKPALQKPTVLFVGNFAWIPNRDAAAVLVKDIWPEVLLRIPNARLRVVGKNMPPWLVHMDKKNGIKILQHVSDIREEYNQADMLLAPMKIAGGTKFKILEAFASGVPVISTKEGVFGLEVIPGVQYLEATNSVEFASRVFELSQRNGSGVKIAQAARKKVEAQYSWDVIARSLDTVWGHFYEKHN